ncbi:MAG: hypothetical protein L0H41_12415 [Microlunatus sp.]|nr:hypothetical protein [Microlunatus sp.]
MSDDECIHGMTRAWCDACRVPTTVTTPAPGTDPYGGRSRQLLFDDLCQLLDVPRYVPGPGSTPSRVFSAAAARAEVDTGSMPEVGEAIAVKAGLVWGPDCDNRQSREHGTVVSRDGVGVVVQALKILAESNPAAR